MHRSSMRAYSVDRVSSKAPWGEGEQVDHLPDDQTDRLHQKERSVGAGERDEFLRAAWRVMVVDEMGTNTSLAPLYAYSPKGQRANVEVPRNRGPNIALLSSLSVEGVGPSLAVEESTTAGVFEACVERFLAAELEEGRVVVMDRGCPRTSRIG
jgi:hypothetical protein